MSQNNGIIRIGRKGIKKFAFGEDGPIFQVDVVAAMQQWFIINDNFRPEEEDSEGNRPVPMAEIPALHAAAVDYVKSLQGANPIDITVAESLDFLARLREQFNELTDFFQPRTQEKQDSQDTSEAPSQVQFSVEGEEKAKS